MKADDAEWSARQFVAATCALFALIPTVMVLPPLVTGRLSLGGTLYGLRLLIGSVGLVALVAKRRWAPYLIFTGLIVGAAVGGQRLSTTGVGGHFTGGDHRGSLVAEQDFMVVGATWLPFLGLFESHENRGFAASIAALSKTIREEEGSLLGLAFAGETYVYPAEGEHQGMLIFLLGYAGDVPSFCWVVASAAAQVGWTTHCPSCGFTGAWWEPECSSRVHRIAGNAREQGRVVLGGLSSGARGAATLVTAGLHDLDDALLISGGAYETGPGPFALLMIYGLEDARFPTDLLERYAATAGDNATVVPRPFGHFLLTKDFETVRSEIRAWLRGLPG